jgi:tetratricopeptide (TPR) repeat protein
MLSRAAEAQSGGAERAASWRAVAALCEQKLSDAEGAAHAWRRVCDAAPEDHEARAELRRLLHAMGRTGDLSAALRAELARTPLPEAKLPLLEALLAAQRDAREELADLADTLRAILQVAPRNEGAYDALAQLLEEQGRHREVALLYERRLSLTEGPASRLPLLKRLAAVLWQALSATSEATRAYSQILELAPGDEDALAAMREIYTQSGDWLALAKLLRTVIGATAKDPAREATLRLELGRLLERKLGRPEEAAAEYERGLAGNRGNAELIEALDAVYESMGEWEKLIEVLRRRASEHGGLPQSLVDIARICHEKLSSPVRAKELYEQAVHLDPNRRDALFALRRLAEERGDFREAVALLRREEKIVQDSKERASLLCTLGTLLSEKLDRPVRAAEAFEEALRAAPGDSLATERLADLYYAQGDLARAIPHVDALLAAGAAKPRAPELLYRKGIFAEREGHADEAFTYYIESFNHDSMYEPTLTRLAELCFEAGQWENVVRVSEAVAQLCVDRVLSAKTPSPAKPREKPPSSVCITESGELAELYYRHALAELHLGQRQVALRVLPTLALGRGKRSILPETAWLDSAEAWAQRRFDPMLLGQIEMPIRRRAEGLLDQCLSLAPKHLGALKTLAALSVARGRWEDALSRIERCVDLPEASKSERHGLLRLAGDICATKALDRARAERYYRRALLLFEDPALQRKLEELKIPRPPQPS